MKADVENGEEKPKNDDNSTFDSDHDLVRRQRDIEAKREERLERPFYDVIGRWVLDREIKRLEREKRKALWVVVREARRKERDELKKINRRMLFLKRKNLLNA